MPPSVGALDGGKISRQSIIQDPYTHCTTGLVKMQGVTQCEELSLIC